MTTGKSIFYLSLESLRKEKIKYCTSTVLYCTAAAEVSTVTEISNSGRSSQASCKFKVCNVLLKFHQNHCPFKQLFLKFRVWSGAKVNKSCRA